MFKFDWKKHNQIAWDAAVDDKVPWTIPVSSNIISEAKKGNISLIVTNQRPIPKKWLPKLKNKKVLCLGSGGGQQGPILAASGANVVVYDISLKQLEQDISVCKREGLKINTQQGDMCDLSMFMDEEFDLIINPVSNNFIDDLQSVWNGCFRILKHYGILIVGFATPLEFCIDQELESLGILQIKHKSPYSDIKALTEEQLEEKIRKKRPLCFGHSLEAQIQGQIDAGFLISGFMDDFNKVGDLLAQYIPAYAATRAIKPKL